MKTPNGDKIVVSGLLLIVLLLSGCTTLVNKATITKTKTGVVFTADQPCEMSIKEGDIEYLYNGKSESWISRIVSILTLGALSKKE